MTTKKIEGTEVEAYIGTRSMKDLAAFFHRTVDKAREDFGPDPFVSAPTSFILAFAQSAEAAHAAILALIKETGANGDMEAYRLAMSVIEQWNEVIDDSAEFEIKSKKRIEAMEAIVGESLDE